MSLWVDNQHPVRLDELSYHPQITTQLQIIVAHSTSKVNASGNNFPHLLFTGPNGSGKRTRVSALLRDLYRTNLTDPKKLRLEHKSIKINDSKTVEVSLLSSPYHIELNLSEVGTSNDRVVIMTLIKEIAQTASIATKVISNENQDQDMEEFKRPPFQVLVLHQVELLSRGAQQALRRTMEKYVQSCRLILIASGGSGTGKIIAPIRSRCLEIRIPAPTDAEIAQIMHNTLKNEGMAAANDTTNLFEIVLSSAAGDLRRAILMLEAYTRNNKQVVDFPWRVAIRTICQKIKKEQTPRQLHDIRTNVYDLLQSCVPGDLIIKEVCLHFAAQVERLNAKAVGEILQAAALYEKNLHLGSKPQIHIEAFFASLMATLKKYNLNLQ